MMQLALGAGLWVIESNWWKSYRSETGYTSNPKQALMFTIEHQISTQLRDWEKWTLLDDAIKRHNTDESSTGGQAQALDAKQTKPSWVIEFRPGNRRTASRATILYRGTDGYVSDIGLAKVFDEQSKEQTVLLHNERWLPFAIIDGVQARVHDPINHPKHYTQHPSGVECIQITEHMGFNLGNALKHIWRADLKGEATQELEKAKWYLEREIQKRKKEQPDA